MSGSKQVEQAKKVIFSMNLMQRQQFAQLLLARCIIEETTDVLEETGGLALDVTDEDVQTYLEDGAFDEIMSSVSDEIGTKIGVLLRGGEIE